MVALLLLLLLLLLSLLNRTASGCRPLLERHVGGLTGVHGRHSNSSSSSSSRKVRLLVGCLLGGILGLYISDVAAKLTVSAAAAATAFHRQKQNQQEQQQQQQGDSALPEGIEFMEIVSPAVDTRPKLLARLANGLEVMTVQDSAGLEGRRVSVSLSLLGGVLREPRHLPGLSLLVAHCTFRGEKLRAERLQHLQKQQQQQQQPQQQQQQQASQQEKQHQQQEFDSFAELVRTLGGPQPLQLAVSETDTSLSFQVPVEGLELALLGLKEVFTVPHFCQQDLEGALLELRQLQTVLQQKCAADYHCRRNAILKCHVLNPHHRANRVHSLGLELLHALRSSQWRSQDVRGWRRRQKQWRRQQKEQQRQQASPAAAAATAAAGLSFLTSLQLSREPPPPRPAPAHTSQQQQEPQQEQEGADEEVGGGGLGRLQDDLLGGFAAPRLVFVEEIGADVLAADVDIEKAALLWRSYFYAANGLKLVLVGPCSPEELLLYARQALETLPAAAGLKPQLNCADDRASEVEALNPQPPLYAPEWLLPPAAAAAAGTAAAVAAADAPNRDREADTRKDSSSRRRERSRKGPPACPNPKDLGEAREDISSVSAAAAAVTPAQQQQQVARPQDLNRLLLMLPANRQTHSVEFVFVLDAEGPNRPPCADLKACLMLAANLLSMGGPGSCLGALRAAGLAEAMHVTVGLHACAAELRVALLVPGGSLKHFTVELMGKIFFVYLQLLKHLVTEQETWEHLLQRYAAEETAFELHERQAFSAVPSLSGLSTAAAFDSSNSSGSGVLLSPAVSLSPSPPEGFKHQPLLPQLSPLQESAALAEALQAGAGPDAFRDGFLFSRVPPKDFSAFLGSLNPDRLVLVVASPLVGPLCTRLAFLQRLPFAVLPLEERWQSSWRNVSLLPAEETLRVARGLSLALPIKNPFLPTHRWTHYPAAAAAEILATAHASSVERTATPDAEAAETVAAASPVPAETASSTDAATVERAPAKAAAVAGDGDSDPAARCVDSRSLSLEAVPPRKGGPCSVSCEVFIDSRNPKKVPKAEATFWLYPELPLIPPVPTTNSSNRNKNSKSRRRAEKRRNERIRTLVGLSFFVHTVVDMLSDPLRTAALSSGTVSVGVDLQAAAAKVHIQSPTNAMLHLIYLVFSGLWAASRSSNGVSRSPPRGPLGTEEGPVWAPLAGPPELARYFTCSQAANQQTPFCTGQLDVPLFLSVKQRTLLRLSAADSSSWLECIANEMKAKLSFRSRAPRTLVAELAATVSAADAEKAGALLTQKVFIQALFAGDVSTALAGQWADAAAASLGLTADSVLPLLSPLSDMQPIPLAFLTNAHRNHISASSNNNHSSSSRRLRAAPQGVPRVRVRVVASLNKAAACSPKGWQWGGTRSHKEYFLSQGGAHQLYIQLGELSPEQLAAAKVLELALEEILSLHFCSPLPACGTVDVKLLREGGFFISLAVLVRAADGNSRWTGGDALEKFLFGLGGAPRRDPRHLAVPWHLRARRRGDWQQEQGAAALPVFPLKILLSDAVLEKHRERLLANLEGADGLCASQQLAACNSSNGGNSSSKGRSCGEGAGLSVKGRTPAEWAAPTRLVLSEEIWRMRYDFKRLQELLSSIRCISSIAVRAFFLEEVLGGPWLLVEALPHWPAPQPSSREFLFYERADSPVNPPPGDAAASKQQPDPLDSRHHRRPPGLNSAPAHPLWRLQGSWVQLEPASAAAIATAAAEEAAAAAAAAESGKGEKLPSRWGLSYRLPLLYRHRKRTP